MHNAHEEDWLDARLRDEAPYIDDAGFTARVMQQLPAPASPRDSFRGVLLLAITVLACAVTYFVSGGGSFVVSAVRTLAAMPLWMVSFIAVFCGLVATAAAACTAYFQVRRQ